MKTPLPDPVRWPNTAPGAEMDWLEFITEPIGDLQHPVKFRLNVSWLTSRWQCRYGDCPGVLIHGAMTDVACCQIGVEFTSREDFERVRKAVGQLTAEDWDLIGTPGSRSWYTKHTPEGRKTPVPLGTRVLPNGGGCIFANKAGGPAGKPGCALHHLAKRTGQETYETKPDICWQIPMAVTITFDEGNRIYVITVDGSTGALWGWPDSGQTAAIGYWCTETPDAYQGAEMVYVSMAKELTHLIGEDGYGRIKHELDQVAARRRPKPMPGERINGGRPMLPLLVADRVRRWEHEIEGGIGNRTGDASFEAFENSLDFLTKTQTGRKAANLLRST